MSDEDRQKLRELLAPVLVASAKPPPCYRVAGTLKERPDMWVWNPKESVVVTVRMGCDFVSEYHRFC